MGNTNFFDPEKVVAHPELSLASGAIDGWDKRNQFYFQMIQRWRGITISTCRLLGKRYLKKSKKVVLHGSGKEVIDFTYLSERGTTFNRSHAFEGIIPNLERRYRETDSETVREKLREYQNHRACPSCGGARLRKKPATFMSAANLCMKFPPGR